MLRELLYPQVGWLLGCRCFSLVYQQTQNREVHHFFETENSAAADAVGLNDLALDVGLTH